MATDYDRARGNFQAPRHRFLGLQHSNLTVREKIIHIGFLSSLVYLAIMFADVLIPSWLYPSYKWIGLGYLSIQLVEIIARDPLDVWEGLEDHILSILPAILALVLKVLDWKGGGSLLTAQGSEVMNFLGIIAWVDFGFGVILGLRILATPYERNETETRVPPN